MMKELPSVSIIITTYNHAQYLQDAIHSAMAQTHSPYEVIIIDDGSTDGTEKEVKQYKNVKYIWQENSGLSAARNKGIAKCKGDYVVFLDADDMLYPNALATNLKYFHLHPACGYVSGWYDAMNENKKIIGIYDTPPPQKDHFLCLLKNNYIGMHATVMYNTKVFEHLKYDEKLRACEDHDIYLKIAKKYPVFSHSEKIAAYRFHDHNMSHNIKLMLSNALKMLDQNRDDAFDPRAKMCYLAGKRNYRAYYADIALGRIKNENPGYKPKTSLYERKLLWTQRPAQLIKYYLQRIVKSTKNIFQKKPFIRGHVNFGDLHRTKPLSRIFGYDRGGPIDRRYIEDFLKENASCIRGNVLEIGDNFYTKAFGGQRVAKSDVLFVNDSNKEATIIGDLSHADHIPDEQFDCIILTQTLHLIYDFDAAIRHCCRILKRSGTLLLTVPGITQIDYGEWHDTWYWSFTGRSLLKLLTTRFNPMDIQVQTHGNVLAATAFLYGLGKDEVNDKLLSEHDPHYPVIIAAKAVKN
jgi:glycosyltransferase involved in cell wall biosynthesis